MYHRYQNLIHRAYPAYILRDGIRYVRYANFPVTNSEARVEEVTQRSAERQAQLEDEEARSIALINQITEPCPHCKVRIQKIGGW